MTELHAELTIPTLPWTGERMIPNACDALTEMYHWQRYLFFRPWYDQANIIDAASGEGYGTGYAGAFAKSVTGYDLCGEAIKHGSKRYPHVTFEQADVCDLDYSEADLVLSFETIEHLPDPKKFLTALASCSGRIVISTPNRNTHSPNNGPDEKPLNKYHTIEWTPAEFAALIRESFPSRTVRFLSQQMAFPGLIEEGFCEDAMYCIAVIGEGELPVWPRLGVAVPTHNNWSQLSDAIQTLSRTYPGEIKFAATANGCDEQTLIAMRNQEAATPQLFHVIEEAGNRGYGAGANIALRFLRQEGDFDYFAVSNDDVIPTTDCVCAMVAAMLELEKHSLKPGVIGPVSNTVSGHQQVDIGEFTDFPSLMYLAEQYHRANHSTLNQVQQLRGLFMLIHPDCLRDIGGFDPIFGIGNFEDDDHNLRCTLAGYSLWMAAGAFLFHHGSTTFKRIGVDYAANNARNSAIMARKWGLSEAEDWIQVRHKPANVELFEPLEPAQPREDRFEVTINGQTIDLLYQATELEFAGWVHHRLQTQPRELRRAVVEVIEGKKIA